MSERLTSYLRRHYKRKLWCLALKEKQFLVSLFSQGEVYVDKITTKGFYYVRYVIKDEQDQSLLMPIILLNID